MVLAAFRRNDRKRRLLSVRARGGKAVMNAARSRIAAIVTLAAGTALLFAHLQLTGRAEAADPTRERAEDLARAASQRFSEIMKDERGAQPRGKQPAAAPIGQTGGEDPWAAIMR